MGEGQGRRWEWSQSEGGHSIGGDPSDRELVQARRQGEEGELDRDRIENM